MSDTPVFDELRAERAREAEVAALIAKANDPDDPYDGHHGTDRSEDSLEYAVANDPAVAEKIRARLAAAEGDA
jgi:hypothetical protein